MVSKDAVYIYVEVVLTVEYKDGESQEVDENFANGYFFD